MEAKLIVTTSLCVQMMLCLLYNSEDGVKTKYSITLGKVCWSDNGRFAIIFGVSLDECVQECGLRKHCKGLIFHGRSNVCKLFSSDFDADVHYGQCIHVLSEDIETIQTPCDDCAYGEVCDTTAKQCVHKEESSQTSECVSLVPLLHGKILGNMKNVGSKVRFMCDNGYVLKNGIRVAECTASGSWNATAECNQGNVDCYYAGKSQLYEGTRRTTLNGSTCQRWDTQWPHVHRYTDPNSYPAGDLSSSENYCRNPEYDYDQPWCYTTDPNVRWEDCGIPLC